MLNAFAAYLRLVAGRSPKCQRKQMKSNYQRVPVTGYHQIKELRSLDMKYYVVSVGRLSLVQPSNSL